jgi:hypothetical protein
MNFQETLAALQAACVTPRREGENLRLLGWSSNSLKLAAREHKAAILAYLDAKATAGNGHATAVQPVFLDLETRSRVDLRSVGGRRYAAHPTTDILSAVASLDGRILIWTPGRPTPALSWPEGFGAERPIDNYFGRELPPPLAEAIAAGRLLAAHNAWCGPDRLAVQVASTPRRFGC